MGAAVEATSPKLNVANSLRLVPPFNESDVDTFFLLFERVAVAYEWSDIEHALLLKCVLTGKAQQAIGCGQPNL